MNDFILIYTLIGLGLFALTWFLFVCVFWADRNRDKIPTIWHKPIMGLVAVGYVLDAIFNVLFATIIFIQKPDFAGARIRYLPTLSERLRDILRCKTRIAYRSYRYHIALFMCRYIIEPFDKNHCGLDDL